MAKGPNAGAPVQAEPERLRYSVSLVRQGRHSFYTLTMPSNVLARTCVVSTRKEDPKHGFQRVLDEKRALEIANYIDKGMGTIPNSIVLSAQPAANLKVIGRGKTLEFSDTPGAFLILDGQHRVFGFSKASTQLRVPVVVYNGLSRRDESRLFIDINTKQRPVPAQLLLDIKQLADIEDESEGILREIFDAFNSDLKSALAGMMAPYESAKNKITRVTFNSAVKPLLDIFSGREGADIYVILNSYLSAFRRCVDPKWDAQVVAKPVVFRAVIGLFPSIAQRVLDRFSDDYSEVNFYEIISAVFNGMPKSKLDNPGTSWVSLRDYFEKATSKQTNSLKMGLSLAIVRRSLPRIGEYSSRSDGIRSWIEGGSYYIDDQSSEQNITLKNVTLTEVLPYFLFDYERFALPCWESFSIFKEESDEHKLLAWPFIKLYYSAFFGSHAAMRVVGQAVFRLEPSQAKRLTEIVSIFSSAPFSVSSGTYHLRTIQNSDFTIDIVLKRLPDAGGAHDGFWRIFSTFLQEIETETIADKQPDAAVIVSKIGDITRITKAYGGSSGNWLSTIRNKINYGQEFGVWFPIKGSHPSLDHLRGITAKGLDGIRLDINPAKEPLKAFAAASHALASLSFEIAEQIATQSDSATRFGSKWKRLRRDLSDGKPIVAAS